MMIQLRIPIIMLNMLSYTPPPIRTGCAVYVAGAEFTEFLMLFFLQALVQHDHPAAA